MVLGYYFHSVAGYERSRQRTTENLHSPTWRHLLSLEAVPIAPSACFFTNIYMGLRKGPATTGRFPGSRDLEFVARCRHFFSKQLMLLRPRIVLTLGAFVPHFLSPLSTESGVLGFLPQPWSNWTGMATRWFQQPAFRSPATSVR